MALPPAVGTIQIRDSGLSSFNELDVTVNAITCPSGLMRGSWASLTPKRSSTVIGRGGAACCAEVMELARRKSAKGRDRRRFIGMTPRKMRVKKPRGVYHSRLTTRGSRKRITKVRTLTHRRVQNETSSTEVRVADSKKFSRRFIFFLHARAGIV